MVGFIASVSKPFCLNCNRIRLTSDGKIRYCLFAIDETDVKELLRSGAPDERLPRPFARTFPKNGSATKSTPSKFIRSAASYVRYRRLTAGNIREGSSVYSRMMFDQTFVNTQAQTRRPWTVVASLALQVIFVAGLIVFPLFHLERIHAVATTTVWMPLQPAPRPQPPEATRVTGSVAPRPRVSMGVLTAPTHVPAHIDMTADAPDLAGPAIIPQAGTGGILSAVVISAPPPPVVKQLPLQPPPPAPPVRISMGAQAAKLIFAPKPAYPALARAARVQGTVKIQAVISRDGAIKNLQVVSGPPLLVEAAIAAVQQWRYQPTLLNSEPVEVSTEIDVNFTLN